MKNPLVTFWFACLAIMFVSCSSKQASVGDERYKWNLLSTAGDYDRIGLKDSKWDGPVKAALTDYAHIVSGQDMDQETRLYLIGSAADDAVKAGCKDPLIRYLYCDYSLSDSSKGIQEKQAAFKSMADDMESSSYSPLRKFNANMAAARMLWWQYDTNLWPQVRKYRINAINDLVSALQNRQMPVEETYGASHEVFEMLSRNTKEFTNAYAAIEQPLFKNWPRAGTPYLIKGEFYLEYAWRGRGDKNANQVTQTQWDNFHSRLKVAEEALNEAWSLNPNDPVIPVVMISVVEGSEKPRPEMEKWFNRAMELDTNNYTACKAKLHYLYPEWYGSAKDMLAFGHECLDSTNWGGHVPITLVDAHAQIARSLPAEERQQYWASPEVWTDIKAAYEKFAQLNPYETRFRYPYAAYAVRCGKWDDFNTQVKLIQNDGNDFNYDYFGGKDEFNKLVAPGAQPHKR